MKRRDFLGAAAGAVAGLTAGAALAQRAATGKLDQIGLQLYTLRDMMKSNVARTLAAVAEAGYNQVEFAGYFDVSARDMKKLLDANGLTAPSAHIAMSELDAPWESTLENALTLGHEYLTVSWIDEPLRTLEGYRRVAETFNAAGRRSRESGVQLAFHNHSYGFEPIGGEVPYEILLRGTDPRYLAMEADVFWMRQAGQDPLAWFARYPGRFHMLHLKDMGPPPANQMLDVGKGVMDWAAILSRSKAAGVRYYFVEHDEPADPIASIRSSYRYLRALRFT